MNKNNRNNRNNNSKSYIVLNKKKKLKKAVRLIVLGFAVLAVLYLVLWGVNTFLLNGKNEDKTVKSSHETPKLDGKNYINFYEPDYETDIFTDKDYLKQNRVVKYVVPSDEGNVGIVLDEYDKDKLNEMQRFFLEYFDVLKNGDYEKYHTLFAKEYIKNPEGFEKLPDTREFPMQRVYDITVSELGKTAYGDESYVYNGKKAVFGVFDVRYKILKNDGELRYDVPENGEIPLIFELVCVDVGTENEKTYIRNIYKYSDIENG